MSVEILSQQRDVLSYILTSAHFLPNSAQHPPIDILEGIHPLHPPSLTPVTITDGMLLTLARCAQFCQTLIGVVSYNV